MAICRLSIGLDTGGSCDWYSNYKRAEGRNRAGGDTENMLMWFFPPNFIITIFPVLLLVFIDLTSVTQSVSPPLCSCLKYLNKSLLDYHESLYLNIHDCQRMKPLTFPLVSPLRLTFVVFNGLVRSPIWFTLLLFSCQHFNMSSSLLYKQKTCKT